MITFKKVSQRKSVFSRMTGLTVIEFELLHDVFASFWREFVWREFISRQGRLRSYGGGNKPKMKTTEDLLTFILIYFRLYPLQIVQGFWFGLDESVANRWIHRLTPVLEKTLGYKAMLPKRQPGDRGRTVAEIVEEYPDLKEFLIDGMEQPIRRPKNREKQSRYYSGKKKRHVKKNILLANPRDTFVHFLGATQEGSKHDKACADEESLAFTSDVDIGGDLGFEGYTAGNARVVIPAKKPRGKDLPVILKGQNQALSRIRVRVEHAIAGIKRSQIAADIFRNTRPVFADQAVLVATGLHNLRVRHRFRS